MANIENLIASLPVINGAKPKTFIYQGSDFDCLAISGEYGDCLMDYYGEFNNGQAWIQSDLLEWAKAQGGFFEWLNPGAIVFNAN
jgi:hypothetical protein